LEKKWRRHPLVSVELAMEVARRVTYCGKQPTVSLHEGGAPALKKAGIVDKIIAGALERKEGLEKWAITIRPEKAKLAMQKLSKIYAWFS
jgi:hypothetical protein